MSKNRQTAHEFAAAELERRGLVLTVPESGALVSAAPDAISAARMPTALRVMADQLAQPFGGLCITSRRRIAKVCIRFADIIRGEEDGAAGAYAGDVRAAARQILGALHVAALTWQALPVGEKDAEELVTAIEAMAQWADAESPIT